MGDAAGIGPETIVRALRQAPELLHGCLVAGDLATLRRAAAVVARVQGGPRVPVLPIASVQAVENVPRGALPVLQVVGAADPVPFGHVSARAGKMAGDCVFWAARAALAGDIAALVTAPLNKEALAAAGAPYDRFPGHTELLQSVAAEHLGVAPDRLPVRMMLADDALRVVLVSIHLALRDALDAVTRANIEETLRITHTALGAVLGRPPRIAVAGLNPHAGEAGRFGHEEIEIIAPAIAAARAAGVDASGPYAPDTVFMRVRGFKTFDVAIAMYHDQGLIPIKYLGVERGVNVTLGLPLTRTSPDHGTAFDIAGQGIAEPASLMEAIRVARRLAAAPR